MGTSTSQPQGIEVSIGGLGVSMAGVGKKKNGGVQ